MKKIISSILILLAAILVFYFISVILENREEQEFLSEEISQDFVLENQEPVSDNKSNMITEILEQGNGQEAENNDKLTVHYTGWLEDGTKFDSSLDRDRPFEFVLGIGQVIEGWDKGLLGMKVGEKRKLTIPPELGYGQAGAGPIPPEAVLIFEIELLKIDR